MIDGLKFILRDNLDRLREHSFLDFHAPVSTTTGELIEKKWKIAKYQGLLFEDRIKYIEVRGSIHKYFNEGVHNWNDFGINELWATIKSFCSTFNINPFEIRLSNLEVGVNIQLPFRVSTFLDSLIMNRGSGFDKRTESNMNYRECKHSQYYIKIYDKGLQYNFKRNLLRFELKYRKMERPNGIGIYQLSDLFDHNKLIELSTELLRIYDEIYIGDISIKPVSLSTKDSELFLKGQQFPFWESEKPGKENFTPADFRRVSKNYEKKLERFKLLLQLTGADNKKKIVRKQIEEKINQLLKPLDNILFKSFEDWGKLTNNIGETDRGEKGKLTGYENRIEGETDTLLYSVRNEQPERICKVTGFNISMQKESSLFLCTTGIKYFMDHDPKIWEDLKKRLSNKWFKENIDIQIREIAHSIRNEFNNSNRDVVKRYLYPSLFDQSELIKKEKYRMFSQKSELIANNNKIQCHAI